MIETYRDEGGGYRFRVKGKNGEIVATSEAYTRWADADRGARDLIRLLGGNTEAIPLVHV